ncbi:CTL-like protein 2 [Agrilus planipennis]|uniref:Choline transporter-like protein n=1 Tax=Agrilus planipennis TaxID=224129 RepID=A0A7F5RFZ9_AGRPL|nr:CTL-like protein 2 [Agrilus planipennis]
MMRWTAGLMVWLSIIGVLAFLGLCVYITVDNYLYYRNSSDSPSNFLTQYISTKNVWLVLAIAASFVLVVILLILLVLRSRICLAIVLVKESSKAISSVTASLFFPVFPWIIQIVVIIYGLVIGLFLLTLGDPYYQVRNMDPNCACTGNGVNYTTGSECVPTTFASSCNSTACSSASCYFVRIDSPSYINAFHGKFSFPNF